MTNDEAAKAGADAGEKIYNFIHHLITPVLNMIPGVSGNHQTHTLLGLSLTTEAWANLIMVALAIVAIGLVVGIVSRLVFGVFFKVLQVAIFGFIAFGGLLFLGKLWGIGL
jgi:hypothetical protein